MTSVRLRNEPWERDNNPNRTFPIITKFGIREMTKEQILRFIKGNPYYIMNITININTVGSNSIKGTVGQYMRDNSLSIVDIAGWVFNIFYSQIHPNIKAYEVFEDIEWVESRGAKINLRKEQ